MRTGMLLPVKSLYLTTNCHWLHFWNATSDASDSFASLFTNTECSNWFTKSNKSKQVVYTAISHRLFQREHFSTWQALLVIYMAKRKCLTLFGSSFTCIVPDSNCFSPLFMMQTLSFCAFAEYVIVVDWWISATCFLGSTYCHSY